MDESPEGSGQPLEFGIDTVTTQEGLAAVLRALHHRHAKSTQQKLTHKQIASRTGYAVGTINNYLKGRTLPSSERLSDLLTVFDVTVPERTALLSARDRVDDRRAGFAQAPSHEHDSDSAPGGKQDPPRRTFLTRLTPLARAAVIAGALLVAIVVAAQTYSWLTDSPSGAPAVSYSAEWSYLGRLPQPQPAPPWNWLDPACTPQRTHTYRFPVDFVGVVYVHTATQTPGRSRATLELSWGNKTWTELVAIEPGLVRQGQGGTLVAFTKGSVDQSAPGLTFASSIPVCAVFGTADTAPPPAPSEKLVADGWIRR